MWDDEDNNPYGSFERHDSSGQPLSPSGHYGQPATPPEGTDSHRDDSPEFISQHIQEGDEEEVQDTKRREPKKGGYNSRIEQILYENPDLPILITYAGKNLESGGSYIAYTIRTGDLEVRRRYSEFASLRQTLVNLHPTLVIPPIPEKHTMADYAAKPTKAKEDAGIIELRKRMLAVFLNRCRRMDEVREDGVWWRFLDPNASWSEVINSPPVSNLPKNILQAPPLDPANPSAAHAYLPVPSTSAKLKNGGDAAGSGTPVSPPQHAALPSAAAHSIPGPQVHDRFPPTIRELSEEELDPYFVNFENASKQLEQLLQGSMEKSNRRLLTHLNTWGEDMMELGGRYNSFSLSEQSQTLAAAIEKIGQAVDSTYIATNELSSSLSASFAEPMRESAQFAGVVRSVLRYRILKRVQEDMTKSELEKKRALLTTLESSEQEAQRIQQHLSTYGSPSSPPRRSMSSGSARSSSERHRRDDDTASVDSDFPSTQGDSHPPPSASQGLPENEPTSPQKHAKSPSGNFVTNKIFGRISHAFGSAIDADPEKSRRDSITRTRESIMHLGEAVGVSEKDTKDASMGVLKDLKRFQLDKEEDLRRYMIAFARCHIDWAKRNQQSWEEAKAEVRNIEPSAPSSQF